MNRCPHCIELQRKLDDSQRNYADAIRLLEKVLVEVQALDAAADPKFQKLLKTVAATG